MIKGMGDYSWEFQLDGNLVLTQVCEASHKDLVIGQRINDSRVENIRFINGEDINILPYVLKYCVENKVNLKEQIKTNPQFKKFLNIENEIGNHCTDLLFFSRIKQDFGRPLEYFRGGGKDLNGNFFMKNIFFPFGKNESRVTFPKPEIGNLLYAIMHVRTGAGIMFHQYNDIIKAFLSDKERGIGNYCDSHTPYQRHNNTFKRTTQII